MNIWEIFTSTDLIVENDKNETIINELIRVNNVSQEILDKINLTVIENNGMTAKIIDSNEYLIDNLFVTYRVM